jgi:hypothetical protein
MKSVVRAVALAGALAVPFSAGAQGKDDLWEVTSQMSAPGMPAGMGAMTHQMCQDRDPAKQTMQGQNMENCRIIDRKQSGNTLTMRVQCPDGTAVIEQTYNAARTEYKGSMRMGDMVMNMSGRKVGSCDAQQARTQQNAQQAQIKAHIDRAQAQTAAQYKQMQEDAIRDCAEAVETMNAGKLGTFGRCHQQAELCKSWESAGIDPGGRAQKACAASRTQMCASYQTPDGYMKANGSAELAKLCGLDAQAVKASLCPKVPVSAFLGRHCLVEAKPIAQQQCGRSAGRNFTAMSAGQIAKDEYYDFCRAYLAHSSLEEEAPSQQSRTPSKSDQVKQGIDQGINKLKGLFGR